MQMLLASLYVTKFGYIHTVKHWLVMQRKEILAYTEWIHFKIIMRSERSQTPFSSNTKHM